MDIVYDYVWYALGAAGLAGFLIAWIIRGLMLAGKRRRATVERDVAITELEQVRGELDSLYAAQRKQKQGEPAAAPDDRLARMARELESAKAELQVLRTSREGPDATAPAGDSEALSALQSRNEFLEERVGELEIRLHDMAADTGADTGPAAEEGPEEDKLEWQVDYLKGRVAALEEQLLEAGKTEAAAEKPAPDNSLEEELARLRWRNRYLEGRLAYFEEAPEAGMGTAEISEERPLARDVSPTPERAPDLPADPEPQVAANEDEAETPADAPAEDEASPDDEHPSERMLRALGPDEEPSGADEGEEDEPGVAAEAPPVLEKPDGQADDLTLITGDGPRIQTILNDLGIWHFSQIAQWSAENEAWVDSQLNFAGRVGREGWVRQARDLVAANEQAGAGN